jgi:Skp family chaperone for outer membrane proteins
LENCFEEEKLIELSQFLKPIIVAKKISKELIEKGEDTTKYFFEKVVIDNLMKMSIKCQKHSLDYFAYCEIEKTFLCERCLCEELNHLKEHEKSVKKINQMKKEKMEELTKILHEAEELEKKLNEKEKKLFLLAAHVQENKSEKLENQNMLISKEVEKAQKAIERYHENVEKESRKLLKQIEKAIEDLKIIEQYIANVIYQICNFSGSYEKIGMCWIEIINNFKESSQMSKLKEKE